MTVLDTALLLFRVVIGLILVGHGAQKLLGWFEGPGLKKLSQGLGSQGLKPGWLWVGLAVLGEFGGGLSLVLGLLTPLGAAGCLGAMVMAASTHLKNGFWSRKGGYEYTLTLVVACLTLGLTGPGNYSLDALLRFPLPEASLFGVLAVVAVIVDLVGVTLKARHAAAVRAESTSKTS